MSACEEIDIVRSGKIVRNAFKLFANTLNMNVNGSAVAVVIKSPNLVEELISREHPVRVAGEMIKKLKLFRRSVNLFALDSELIVCQIYRKVVVGNLLYLAF